MRKIYLVLFINLVFVVNVYAACQLPDENYIAPDEIQTVMQNVSHENICTNDGRVESQGDFGILSQGPNNHIINNGYITADKRAAIFLNATNNSVENNNLIEMFGTRRFGITEAGYIDYINIINNGTINIFGGEGAAISLHSDNFVANNGKIFVEGHGKWNHVTRGIEFDLRSEIFNTGIIEVNSNKFGAAIFTSGGDNNVFTNSGTLIARPILEDDNLSNDPFAILIDGFASTDGTNYFANNFKMVLTPSSIIMGKMALGLSRDVNGVYNNHTLEIQKGLNIVATFEKNLPWGDPAFLPGIIETHGVPYVVNEDTFQIAVIDPQIFLNHVEILSDISYGIKAAVHQHIFSEDRIGKHLWASGFGNYRSQHDGSEYVQGGSVKGIDWNKSKSLRFGAYFGATYTEINPEATTRQFEAQSYFGGFHVSHQHDMFNFQSISSIGYIDHERSMVIANNRNMVTGLDKFDGDFSGLFMSHEASIMVPMKYNEKFTYRAGLHIGYAGLYNDSNSLGYLQTEGRDIHLLTSRLQLDAIYNIKNFSFIPKIGLELQSQLGDRDLSATVIGKSINIDTGDSDLTYRPIVGLGIDGNISENFKLTSLVEGSFIDDGSTTISGLVGMQYRF